MFKKIALLIASILIVATLWFVGAEVIYARVMTFASNVVLSIGGSDTHLTVDREDGEDIFRVHTEMDDQEASYPQKIQTLLYPTIIVLSWQVFVAFISGARATLRSGKWNLGLFFAFQVLFLLLLTAYYTSPVAAFIYDMMLESFYVIAVVIIIIDNIRHPVFLSASQSSDND